MSYTKQTWVDHVTPIDAARMNHIEDGIYEASNAVPEGIQAALDSKITNPAGATEGKVLKIGTNGEPEWAEVEGAPAAKELPDVTAADNGKVLGVSNGEWAKVDAPSGQDAELPDVTAADNGKVLGVSNGEWTKVDAPSGSSSVTVDDTINASSPNPVKNSAIAAELEGKLNKPATDGTSGQVLMTDGQGGASWQDAPSSGDVLPGVTADDNGKILSVEDGAWAKVNVLNNSMIEAGVANYLDEHPEVINEMMDRTFTAKLTMASMSAGGLIYQWQANFDMTAPKKCVGTIYWIEIGDYEENATITCQPHVDIGSGETFKVYFFTSAYSANGNVVLTAAGGYQTTIPANTKYIKLGVTSNSELSYSERYVDVTVRTNLLRWHGVRNFLTSADAITTDGTLRHNCTVFEVKYNGQRLVNLGWFFPSFDYQPVGKKSKLVMLFQGSDGYKWKQPWSAFSDNYHAIVFSLVHSGYSVALCSSSTTLNSTFPDCSGDQVSINAYDNYYKFITENFNVEKEPYLLGYSNGGMPCGRYNILGSIPAKAIAGGVIITEIVGLFRILGAANNINRIMHCCGVPSDVTVAHSGPDLTNDDFEVLKSQGDVLKNYSPFFMNTDGLDWNEYIDTMKNVSFVNMETNPAFAELMSNVKVHTKVPIKMWHARDDVNVSYGLEKFYIEAVNRGGGVAFLRTMPNDAGKHAMGNYGNNASIKVTNYHFNDGTVADTTLFMTEVLDWFASW